MHSFLNDGIFSLIQRSINNFNTVNTGIILIKGLRYRPNVPSYRKEFMLSYVATSASSQCSVPVFRLGVGVFDSGIWLGLAP